MRALAVLTITILGGCTTITPVTSSISERFEPDVGSVSTRELGDSLVSYRYAITKPSLKILAYAGEKPDNWNAFKTGTVLEPLGTAGGIDFELYRSPAATQTTFGDFDSSVLCRRVSTKEWTYPDGGLSACGAANFLYGNFEKVTTAPAVWYDVTAPNVQQQFIYNGRIDNYVKFTYREFSVGGYARDAFTQDVQYDLDEGNVIGFKGSRIEILEATNRQITYKLISHFKGVSL